MTEPCELCRRDALECVYEPEGSGRGLKIYLCGHCGLVQSLPRADRAPRRNAAVSSGADWGNVRYGKFFRTRACLDALSRHADLGDELRVLDVGSNRGSFAKAFLEASPASHLVAVEPDERVVNSCADLERTQLIHARIEDVTLEDESLDAIHSCHTIEHLATPMRTLADHWRVLKPGGILVMDAPNTALIGTDDIVEEWFIDKHLYHFSARTLARMMETQGFEIVEEPDESDKTNVLLVGRKTAHTPAPVTADFAEADTAKHLVQAYTAIRKRNMVALESVADELSALSSHKGVAIWGAGRLFDSLVVHGHFDARKLQLLIDAHLKAHVGERHGCTLAAPEALAGANAGIVVVMSRAFAEEISGEVKRLAPQAEIILYADLLARAKTGAQKAA